MNIKEAITKIRQLLKENPVFYPDEKREMDEAVDVVCRHFRGNAYLHEKCVEISGYWSKLSSPGKLAQSTHDSEQLHQWMEHALDILESSLELED